MVVLIFVAGEDAKHATTHHLQHQVIGIASPVVELLSKTLGQLLMLIPLSKDQQASIRREILVDRLHPNRFLGEKIEPQLPNIV
jgi:hypothetical protein